MREIIKLALRHPRAQSTMTHAAATGIVLALVTGLHAILPEVGQTLIYLSAVTLAGLAFAGIWVRAIINGVDPSRKDNGA